MFRIVYRRRRRRKAASKASVAKYMQHKEAARSLVHARLAHFNEFYGFTIKRISIKNSTSRWGSCSALGNLNFNYKLALLPPQLADYVVVHELCHLKYFNHSPDFWAEVARMMPHYRALRAELKRIKV